MKALESSKGINRREVMDLYNNLVVSLNNRALGSAGLAIGTSSKKAIRVGSTVAYTVDGVVKSKTAAEVAFTATTHDIAANADSVQERVYLVCIDASGTLSVVAGDVSSGANTAEIPERPSGVTVLGYLRLAVAAGSTSFDASSDDLDAAHLTDTYVNFAGVYVGRFDSDVITLSAE